jgi:outer membrane protein OmpA-like peptidoglycan-associated protein
MDRLKLFYYILICVTGLWGCSSGGGSVIVLLPDAEGMVGKAEVSNSNGSVLIEKENEAVSVKSEKKPQNSGVMQAREFNEIFETALASEPILPAKFFINFKFDSDKIVPESKPVIQLILSDIQKRPFPQIIISGHADRKGESDRNYRLSVKRARLVTELLITAGILPEIIETTAHGENLPLIQTADDIPKLQNRRVEVLVR